MALIFFSFLSFFFFSIYNLGILCIEYLQVHIRKHTYIVKVKLRVRVFVSRRLALCDFLVCFPDDPPSQLHRLQISVLSHSLHCLFVLWILCLCRRKTFSVTWSPSWLYCASVSLAQGDRSTDMFLRLRSKNVLPMGFF